MFDKTKEILIQLEAQGNCTRQSVENIRYSLDKKVSLEIESYREQIKQSDLQKPIVAKYREKIIVIYPCDPRYCTGCMSCVQSCPVKAISKIKDDEGFYIIKIDETKCIGCNKCIDYCHVNKSKEIVLRTPRSLYACYSKSPTVRSNSSSGGVFSELAKKILERGGAVFGATFDHEFVVKHIGIKSEEELDKIRGSKYVQSDASNTFSEVKECLEQNIVVLFSGTPCQAAALRHYIGFNPNLYIVDVVCHGMSSPKFFHDYKEALIKEYGPIESFSFRNKITGWKEYSICVKFKEGDEYTKKRLEEPYTKAFLEEYINKPVCHRCQYARCERVGDITLADFWGFQTQSEKINDDDKGISACIINSLKGENLFNSIADKVVYEERNYIDLVNCNRPLKDPSLNNIDRSLFWDDYKEYGFGYACEHWLG